MRTVRLLPVFLLLSSAAAAICGVERVPSRVLSSLVSSRADSRFLVRLSPWQEARLWSQTDGRALCRWSSPAGTSRHKTKTAMTGERIPDQTVYCPPYLLLLLLLLDILVRPQLIDLDLVITQSCARSRTYPMRPRLLVWHDAIAAPAERSKCRCRELHIVAYHDEPTVVICQLLPWRKNL